MIKEANKRNKQSKEESRKVEQLMKTNKTINGFLLLKKIQNRLLFTKNRSAFGQLL
jgi:hypothetical protein